MTNCLAVYYIISICHTFYSPQMSSTEFCNLFLILSDFYESAYQQQ